MIQAILIGTSGYGYAGSPPKGWFGAFYTDVKVKGFDELKYYSQIFDTVEINTTFYRPPSEGVTNLGHVIAVFRYPVACCGVLHSHRRRQTLDVRPHRPLVLMKVAARRSNRFEIHFRLPELFRDQMNDIIFNLKSPGNA